MRPLSEPKPATPTAAEDPLAELVRIMSAQLIVDATPATGGKAVPAIGAVGSDVAVANDLEAKLLNDLAAVSSAFYSHPPSPPPPAPSTKPGASEAMAVPAAGHPKPQAATSAAATPGAPSLSVAPIVPVETPAIPPRAEKRLAAVSLPLAKCRSPRAGPAGRPQVGLPATNASEKVAKEKPEVVKALLRATTAAAPAGTDPATARPSGDRENRAVKSPAAAFDPSRLAKIAHPPLFQPKAAKPKEDELPKVAPSSGAVTEEEAAPREDQDAPGFHLEEDGDLQPLPDEIEEFSHHRARGSLVVVGGAMFAVVLAAGVTYVMARSEKPVARAPIIAADPGPAKTPPSALPADNDPQKNLILGVDGAQSADQTKLVAPGSERVAEVPASSGRDHDPISRVIEPAGPGFDQPAKAGDGPALADRPATDVAAGGNDGGQISPMKASALVVGPPMPAVGSKAASDEGADKPSAGASPAVPLSATHGADSGAADARSDAPPRETQMDAVINGTGSPIPINPDPLAISGGDKAADASAGAVAARGRSPEPGSVSASDASGAAPASKNGAAAADDAWAVAAAPARVPIPPVKPVVLPDKERSPLPTAPPVASSGGIY